MRGGTAAHKKEERMLKGIGLMGVLMGALLLAPVDGNAAPIQHKSDDLALSVRVYGGFGPGYYNRGYYGHRHYYRPYDGYYYYGPRNYWGPRGYHGRGWRQW